MKLILPGELPVVAVYCINRVMNILLILVLQIIMESSAENELAIYRSPEEQMLISRNMTTILNFLVASDLYDRRLRPNYGGHPVDVNITMHVTSISHVSEVEMDYTIDIYLRQTWVDPRLTWRNVPIDEITISVDYMKHIWVPDTFFPNEKKSFFHTATTHNSFLRITNKGRITTSQRLTVTASCGMDLHYFPLDTQICTLEIESYGYSAEDIVLHWAVTPGKEPVVVDNQTELPTFALKQPLKYDRTIESLTTGDYSRLSCKFEFERTLGFYWIQIYQPSILIVIISWVTFWINRDSAPARVTLGIMTVLTMTTLMSTTNRQMPKVSYIKAVDIYLVVCYVMVFAALLEYAVVSYSNKKKQDINKKKQVAVKTATARSETPMTQMTSGHSTLTHRKPATNSVTTSSPSDGISLLNLTSQQSNPLSIPEDPRTTFGDAPLIDESEFTRLNFMIDRKTKKQMNKYASRHRIMSFDDRIRRVAGGVDKYSRMIFPAIFTMFNVIYWLAFLRMSGKL